MKWNSNLETYRSKFQLFKYYKAKNIHPWKPISIINLFIQNYVISYSQIKITLRNQFLWISERVCLPAWFASSSLTGEKNVSQSKYYFYAEYNFIKKEPKGKEFHSFGDGKPFVFIKVIQPILMWIWKRLKC